MNRSRLPKQLIHTLLLALCAFAYPVHALEAIKYSPNQRIHFEQSAQFLADEIQIDNATTVIEQYLDVDSNWKNHDEESRYGMLQHRYNWQRLSFYNPLPYKIDLFLVHGEPGLLHGQFVILRNGSVSEKWQVGTHLPFSERPVPHRMYLMPFSMNPGETVTILAGYNGVTISKSTQIIDRDQFWAEDAERLVGDGMYFGASALMSLLIVLLYFVNHDRVYLYCYLIILGDLLYLLARGGYAFQYLWPEWTNASDEIVMITVCIPVIGGILFARRFLQLEERKIYWLTLPATILLWWNFLLIALIVFAPPQISVPSVIINVLIGPAYFLAVWIYSSTRALKGDTRALFYAIAWLLYLAPDAASTFYSIYFQVEELPLWLQSRNGEILFSITLYMALLYELRKAQVEKKAAQLESKAKSDFVATMSHELRTPLNGVIGMAELLAQTEQTPIQRHYSDVIMNSGSVLLTLINDILDLTKITEGRLVLEQHPFNIDQILAECSSTFLPIMMKKNVPLYVSIDPQVPLRLIGDEYRLRQIMFNLLSNAMKFTDEGQVSLHISTPTMKQSVAQLSIKVQDSGVGIESESLTNIFGQFNQADASTTRRFGGSGLGLAICKAIVEQMNGTITVASTPGKGSVFTASLDITIDTEEEKKRAHLLQALKGKRILFLFDHEGILDTIMPHIRHWGVTFDILYDISEARQQLATVSYDAIIAFYVINPAESIRELRTLDMDTLVLHHTALDIERDNWPRKILFLPVPTPIQVLTDTLRTLLTDKDTPVAAPKPDQPVTLDANTAILLVEDNAINQMVAVGMLKTLGFTPDVADDGKDAVAMVEQKPYGIIFMDCEMPVMDGYTASRRIAALDQHPKPIIVALTAHALVETQQRCLDAGMEHILHKPVTLDQIRTCLNSLKVRA